MVLHRSRSLLLWYESRDGRQTSQPGSQVIETPNKHRELHDFIPALRTDLAHSGLGLPGAHCKMGTAETFTPGLRARITCAVEIFPSDEGSSYVRLTSIDEFGMKTLLAGWNYSNSSM